MLTATDLLDGADATDAGIARVFERVRDIPFAFAAHNDADTLLACGAGTCAPVTQGWDGRTSMPLVVNPLSRVESHLPPEHEEKLLGITHRTSFPLRVVEELNAWLQTVRAGYSPADRWTLTR